MHETTPTVSAPTESTATETGRAETGPTLPPPSRPMSWLAAGAFVWHETDVDPGLLGEALRDNGFGWVAVYLHDGVTEDPVEADWVRRFRARQRSADRRLGSAPDRSAARRRDSRTSSCAATAWTSTSRTRRPSTGTAGRPARTARDTGARPPSSTAFRRLQPTLPAGLSSYCRADMHDLDWACLARRPASRSSHRHTSTTWEPRPRPSRLRPRCARRLPSRGSAPDDRHAPRAAQLAGCGRYAPLLDRAGTTGFSVYLQRRG